MKQDYIAAVLSVLQKDPTNAKHAEQVIDGLKKTLAARHHEKLLPAILRGVVRELPRMSHSGVVLTIKDSAALKENQKAVADLLKKYEVGAEPAVQTDPTIIGGFKLKIADTLIDNTYKTKLLNLYRRITA